MLLAGDAGDVNEKQKKYLQETYHASKRMVELINALLNVSRMELGTFMVDIAPTNFSEVAEVCLGELAPQIIQKKLVIKKEYDKGLPLISADAKLLRIIIGNLLSNSVKYTPEGGEVFVKIMKQYPDVLIQIKDTGYGIPKDAQSKIYTKLFRADNIKAIDTDGTGLGLYLVKSIVEYSSGKIWFESEENKGTTFYVTLPLTGMRKKLGEKAIAE